MMNRNDLSHYGHYYIMKIIRLCQNPVRLTNPYLISLQKVKENKQYLILYNSRLSPSPTKLTTMIIHHQRKRISIL